MKNCGAYTHILVLYYSYGYVYLIVWMWIQVQEEVGTIDILVNNAGLFQYGSFLDLDTQRFERLMTVNSIAHFWVCSRALLFTINLTILHT